MIGRAFTFDKLPASNPQNLLGWSMFTAHQTRQSVEGQLALHCPWLQQALAEIPQ
jgi:hypothetical protein